MRKGALAVACTTFIGAIACVESRFTCENDDACAADGVQGTCEPTGACSFPDDSCPSGRRYGDHGRSDLAGACVEDDATGSTSSTTTPTTTSVGETVSSLDTTLTSTATTLDTSTASEVGSSSEGPSACPPDWWDCAWTRRVELMPKPLLPVDEAPVLVRLTVERFDFAVAHAEGADLRVVQGGVVLPHEIEQFSADGSAVVWIGVPVLGDGAAGSLWLYHGNPAATDAQDGDAVWGDDYGALWHFTGGLADSSGNANTGVATQGVLESPGWIGNATELGAPNHRIDVPAAPSIEDVLIGGGTLSAWVFLNGWGGTSRGRIADNTAGADGGWMFYTSNDNGGELRVRQGYLAEQVIWRSPSRTITLGQWYHVAATFTALGDETPRMFIDGAEVQVLQGQGNIFGDPVSDAGNELVIGNSDVVDRWFDGLIDELRIERTVRSPEWIAVQVQSMRDELLIYGAIERLEDLQ